MDGKRYVVAATNSGITPAISIFMLGACFDPEYDRSHVGLLPLFVPPDGNLDAAGVIAQIDDVDRTPYGLLMVAVGSTRPLSSNDGESEQTATVTAAMINGSLAIHRRSAPGGQLRDQWVSHTPDHSSIHDQILANVMQCVAHRETIERVMRGEI